MTRRSQSSKAGLIMPVSRFSNKLRHMPQRLKRTSAGAGVYLTAVIEYLTAEILELGGNAARDCRHKRISPRHLLLAIISDEELHKLLKSVVIPGAGVLPHIQPELLGRTQPVSLNTAIRRSRAHLPFKTVKNSTPRNAPPTKNWATGSFKFSVMSERTLPSGQKLTVLESDITKVKVDAIVHPTNSNYSMGGQVGGAIARVGGTLIRDTVADLAKSKGSLNVCEAELSDAPTMLCKKIVHVHSPQWNDSQQATCVNDLTKTVVNLLTKATEAKLTNIALPCISSGGNNFPKQLAAQTILRAINNYFKTDAATAAAAAAAATTATGTTAAAGESGSSTSGKSSLTQVYFVLYDTESVNLYKSELGKLDITAKN